MANAEKIQKALKNHEADAFIITSPSNRFYATSFRSSAGIVFVTEGKSYFVTDFRYIEAAQNNITGFEVSMIDAGRNYAAFINDLIAAHNVKKLGFEDMAMSYSEYNSYKQALNAELVPIGNAVTALRASKEQWEIERMIKAQRIAEAAFDDVLKIIKPGITEKEIAAELIYRQHMHGAEGVSFSPIVVSGVNSSMPHGTPSDKKVEAGDFVTMDFGSKYLGYCSDMTRTVAVGYATDEMKKIYDIVLEAQLAAIAYEKAGVYGRDVDAVARKIITDAGYGDCFGHGFGHSLGIDVHEAPNANQSETGILPVGACVSAEPGIYIPGKFGVRIEDVTIMTEDGCENITKAKKDLLIL